MSRSPGSWSAKNAMVRSVSPENVHAFDSLLTFAATSLASHRRTGHSMGSHASCNDCRSLVEPASSPRHQSASGASLFFQAAACESVKLKIDSPILTREQNDSSCCIPLVRITKFQAYGRSVASPCSFHLLDSGRAILVHSFGHDPQYATIPSRTEHDRDYDFRGQLWPSFSNRQPSVQSTI